jgi:hypothetical protein
MERQSQSQEDCAYDLDIIHSRVGCGARLGIPLNVVKIGQALLGHTPYQPDKACNQLLATTLSTMYPAAGRDPKARAFSAACSIETYPQPEGAAGLDTHRSPWLFSCERKTIGGWAFASGREAYFE